MISNLSMIYSILLTLLVLFNIIMSFFEVSIQVFHSFSIVIYILSTVI
jgi:hypothetical protein